MARRGQDERGRLACADEADDWRLQAEKAEVGRAWRIRLQLASGEARAEGSYGRQQPHFVAVLPSSALQWRFDTAICLQCGGKLVGAVREGSHRDEGNEPNEEDGDNGGVEAVGARVVVAERVLHRLDERGLLEHDAEEDEGGQDKVSDCGDKVVVPAFVRVDEAR